MIRDLVLESIKIYFFIYTSFIIFIDGNLKNLRIGVYEHSNVLIFKLYIFYFMIIFFIILNN